MTISCKMCFYLDGFSNETIKDYLNNLIVQDFNHQKFTDECKNSKVSNSLALPSKHYLDKHKRECLKDFTPVPIPQKNEEYIVDEFIVPDEFKEKSLIDKIGYIQSMLTDVLYKQVVYFNNPNAKFNKSDIDSVKSLFDLILTNYLDFSDLTFSNDKKELEDVGLDMVRRTIATSLVSNKDILDIAKLLLHNKISNTTSNDDESLSVSKIERLIEYMNNPSLKKELDKYLVNPNTWKFLDEKE